MNAAERRAKKRGELEIRKCPFCGFEGCFVRMEKGKDGFRDRYYVICDYGWGGCGAAGGERHSMAEAVGCWNERRRKYRGQ